MAYSTPEGAARGEGESDTVRARFWSCLYATEAAAEAAAAEAATPEAEAEAGMNG